MNNGGRPGFRERLFLGCITIGLPCPCALVIIKKSKELGVGFASGRVGAGREACAMKIYQSLTSIAPRFIFISVFGCFFAATVTVIFASVQSVYLLVEAITSAKLSVQSVKELATSYIQLVDLFLVGPAFYIIGFGLMQLYTKQEQQGIPNWLRIRSLDQLKAKLLKIVIVVITVQFLGEVVSWDGEREILRFGVAIAMVIAAITWLLQTMDKRDPKCLRDEFDEE